jgi:hypothetical protein
MIGEGIVLFGVLAGRGSGHVARNGLEFVCAIPWERKNVISAAPHTS